MTTQKSSYALTDDTHIQLNSIEIDLRQWQSENEESNIGEGRNRARITVKEGTRIKWVLNKIEHDQLSLQLSDQPIISTEKKDPIVNSNSNQICPKPQQEQQQQEGKQQQSLPLCTEQYFIYTFAQKGEYFFQLENYSGSVIVQEEGQEENEGKNEKKIKVKSEELQKNNNEKPTVVTCSSQSSTGTSQQPVIETQSPQPQIPLSKQQQQQQQQQQQPQLQGQSHSHHHLHSPILQKQHSFMSFHVPSSASQQSNQPQTPLNSAQQQPQQLQLQQQSQGFQAQPQSQQQQSCLSHQYNNNITAQNQQQQPQQQQQSQSQDLLQSSQSVHIQQQNQSQQQTRGPLQRSGSCTGIGWGGNQNHHSRSLQAFEDLAPRSQKMSLHNNNNNMGSSYQQQQLQQSSSQFGGGFFNPGTSDIGGNKEFDLQSDFFSQHSGTTSRFIQLLNTGTGGKSNSSHMVHLGSSVMNTNNNNNNKNNKGSSLKGRLFNNSHNNNANGVGMLSNHFKFSSNSIHNSSTTDNTGNYRSQGFGNNLSDFLFQNQKRRRRNSTDFKHVEKADDLESDTRSLRDYQEAQLQQMYQFQGLEEEVDDCSDISGDFNKRSDFEHIAEEDLRNFEFHQPQQQQQQQQQQKKPQCDLDFFPLISNSFTNNNVQSKPDYNKSKSNTDFIAESHKCDEISDGNQTHNMQQKKAETVSLDQDQFKVKLEFNFSAGNNQNNNNNKLNNTNNNSRQVDLLHNNFFEKQSNSIGRAHSFECDLLNFNLPNCGLNTSSNTNIHGNDDCENENGYNKDFARDRDSKKLYAKSEKDADFIMDRSLIALDMCTQPNDKKNNRKSTNGNFQIQQQSESNYVQSQQVPSSQNQEIENQNAKQSMAENNFSFNVLNINTNNPNISNVEARNNNSPIKKVNKVEENTNNNNNSNSVQFNGNANLVKNFEEELEFQLKHSKQQQELKNKFTTNIFDSLVIKNLNNEAQQQQQKQQQQISIEKPIGISYSSLYTEEEVETHKKFFAQRFEIVEFMQN